MLRRGGDREPMSQEDFDRIRTRQQTRRFFELHQLPRAMQEQAQQDGTIEEMRPRIYDEELRRWRQATDEEMAERGMTMIRGVYLDPPLPHAVTSE